MLGSLGKGLTTMTAFDLRRELLGFLADNAKRCGRLAVGRAVGPVLLLGGLLGLLRKRAMATAEGTWDNGPLHCLGVNDRQGCFPAAFPPTMGALLPSLTRRRTAIPEGHGESGEIFVHYSGSDSDDKSSSSCIACMAFVWRIHSATSSEGSGLTTCIAVQGRPFISRILR